MCNFNELINSDISDRCGKLNDVVGTRARAIKRKLRNAESLPSLEPTKHITRIIGNAIMGNDRNEICFDYCTCLMGASGGVIVFKKYNVKL